jgi:phosphoribosyl-AMP cyclohydrolase
MNFDFRYTKDGIIPAIVREAGASGRVLMLAWMNRESIGRTLETGFMHYWSRSRQKLWLKGETSGHKQKVIRWFVDCDQDTLLFEVEQIAGACHTGHRSCFFQELDLEGNPKGITEPRVFDPADVYEQ